MLLQNGKQFTAMQKVNLVFVSVIYTVFEEGDACATYFRTQHFKHDIWPVINNSSNCIEPFIDTVELHFEGKPCRRTFAARGFCRWKCNDDCKMTHPRAIKCEAFADDDGVTPLDITFYCKCFANHLSKSCITPEYTWFDVEEGHRKFCKSEFRAVDRAGPALSSQVQTSARLKILSRTIDATSNAYSSVTYVVNDSSNITTISIDSNVLFTGSADNTSKSTDISTEMSNQNESSISAVTSVGDSFLQESTDANATEYMVTAEIDPFGTFLLEDDNSSIFDPPSQAEYETSSNDMYTLIDMFKTDRSKKKH